MNLSQISLSLLAAASLCALSGCNDENNIGSSVTKGEVVIEVDSLFTVSGHSERVLTFDSRSQIHLLGRLEADGYGTLDCSYAGRLMPAAALTIPDSIPLEDITGMKLNMIFAKKGLVGDSVAPQQLAVYQLTKQLPADINNTTNLEGYYNPNSPLGSKTFSASSLGLNSALLGSSNGVVAVDLDKQFAKDVVSAYRTDPSLFSRPDRFAEKFAGIYVKSTFGRGLVINMAQTLFTTYYQYHRKVTVVKDGVSQVVDSIFNDSTTLFTISPEVLSANLLKLTPAQSVQNSVAGGECILQGPGGYNVVVNFPADQIINRYYSEDFNLSVINSLSFEVPAKAVSNNYGIDCPPYLLMVKTSELNDFFNNNRLPSDEDTDVFYAAYDSLTGSYTFGGMRPYILELMKSGKAPTADDMSFTIVPVNITVEQVQMSDGKMKNYVTACDLYLEKPVLCNLDVAHAKVRFTYSRQLMK